MVTVTSTGLSAGRAHVMTGEPHRYCCVACGYGIVVRALPEKCPMCRASVWETAGDRERAPRRPL
jgi:rubrerythrin